MSVNISNEKKAYAKFVAAGASVFGACGLIGNLEAESDGFCPYRVEYLCIQRLRENGVKDKRGNYYTQETYATAVDSGEISCESFLHPLPGKQYGFGLAQWTSPGRKYGLYTLAKQKGVSIADFDMQIEYVIKEMKESYSSVWSALKTAKSIREASDIVLKKFEAPANTGEAVCKSRAARGQYFYNTYVKNAQNTAKQTAEAYLDVWRSWLGYSEANGKFKQIIDLYNSHKPLARGYEVQYNDEWCDTTVSAAAIKAAMTNLIGTECGCEEHVKIFKSKGIWNEDGTITPKPGDIIVYSWRKVSQPNNAYSDHIGVAESVQNGTITVIEGNKNESVGRRTIPVGWGYIRGYASPKYDGATGSGSTGTAESTDGSLSRGSKGSAVKAMQTMLIAVGYSCGGYGADGDFGNDTDSALRKFQAANGLVADGIYGPLSKAKLEVVYKTYKNSSSSGGLNEKPKWTGKVTADVLNVRVYAGTKYPNIKTFPTLKYGTSVEVCDSVKDEDGDIWYFVRIEKRIYGFVHSAYVKKS